MSEAGQRRRTFILGAGASEHAGGSTMADFVPEPSIVSKESFREPRIEKARDHLARHAIFTGGMNFEQMLTEIDLRLLVLSRESPEAKELAFCRRLLAEAVMSLCSPRKVKVTEQLSHFCRHLNDKDTIVTFNYDIVMEQALWQEGLWTPENGYGFRAPDITSPPGPQEMKPKLQEASRRGLVKVLKPHGSISWRCRTVSLSPSEEQETVAAVVFESGQLAGVEEPLLLFSFISRELSVQTPGTMLLPSFIKTYGNAHPWLTAVWYAAHEAIVQSDAIWIMGYSIPEADTTAQLLLSAIPLTSSVNVVDPRADEVEPRLQRLLPEHEGITALKQPFEEYVVEHFV